MPLAGLAWFAWVKNLGRCTQTSLRFLFSCFYITKDDTTELMVILTIPHSKNIRCFRWAKANNLFQDLSAEKDKNRLAVRCWTKFSMTFGVICYLYSHFGEVNSILLSNPKTHGSLLITHYSKSVSSACHWKFFTKLYFRINPAGKSKEPSWKIFISQLENYFFSVGKSKFRSRAILSDLLGLFLNYFKRFLFILTLMYTLWTKVKMFDSEWWAMNDERLTMSFFD